MNEGARLLRRWFDEVWNEGREEAIDEMMTLDCVAHGLNDEHGEARRGPESFRRFYHQFRSQFVTIRIDLRDFRVEGDRTSARCLVEGIHATSRKPISFAGETIVRLRDGKVAEAWNNFDFHVMDQQLRY